MWCVPHVGPCWGLEGLCNVVDPARPVPPAGMAFLAMVLRRHGSTLRCVRIVCMIRSCSGQMRSCRRFCNG